MGYAHTITILSAIFRPYLAEAETTYASPPLATPLIGLMNSSFWSWPGPVFWLSRTIDEKISPFPMKLNGSRLAKQRGACVLVGD